MARSTKDIKKAMTDDFMSNSTLRSLYEIEGDVSFEDFFSSVSIENLLIYLFAAAAHIIELLFDDLRIDVDARIDANIVPTTRWYHTQSLAFQYGYQLIYNTDKGKYEYSVIDEKAMVVKYAAVKDLGGSISILVSSDNAGKPVPLTSDELQAFASYMQDIKIAGVILRIQSLPADIIRINAIVTLDTLMYKSDGSLISNGSKPVVDAINSYLSNIVYGGVFNKTKLVDAIQSVSGVIDVEIGECTAKKAAETSYKVITGNNYQAFAGCLISTGLENSIQYVV